MTFTLTVLCALVAAVSAGYIDAPGHLAYSAPVAHYAAGPAVAYSSYAAPAKTYSYAAPVATAAIHAAPIARYSSAPSVSHVYSSIGAPTHLSYAAPVAKAVSYSPAHVSYAAPIAKAVSYSPAHVSYASPIAKTVSYAPAHVSYAAPAHYAYEAPAIGSSSHNVIRSFDGTVSQYSKAVDTPFSSVRKVDTRVNNKVYTPAIATKAIHYAAPATTLYTAAHAAPAVYAAAAPAYSAAGPVAHVSFDGLGAHYAW